MKKLVLVIALGVLMTPNYSAQASPQKQATKQVEGNALMEGLAVTATPIPGTDEYLITCSAPEDGIGVLDIFNVTDNEYELQPQQVGIVNGQYQYVFKPKPKQKDRPVPLYRIHFYFGGSVAEENIEP